MSYYVLNLTEGFKPVDWEGALVPVKEIEFKTFKFNGGELHFEITNPEIFDYEAVDLMITLKAKSFEDLGKLALAVDAIERQVLVKTKRLFIPYFPAGRQDRVTGYEALTLKVYADFINSMNFDSVLSIDNHSDVTTALVNNSESIDNFDVVSTALEHMELTKPFALIAPDAGASKKVYKVAKKLHEEYDVDFKVVQGLKHRDTKTGELSGFQVVADDLEGMSCVIVDDICDGGGTFLGLARELKD